MKLHLRDQREEMRNWVKAEARVIKLMLKLFISQKKWLGSCSFDVQQLKTNLHSAT